jgi:hypothetical protein
LLSIEKTAEKSAADPRKMYLLFRRPQRRDRQERRRRRRRNEK